MTKLTTWADFEELYKPLIKELEGEVDALEELARTLRRLGESWQELTDYVNKTKEKGGER